MSAADLTITRAAARRAGPVATPPADGIVGALGRFAAAVRIDGLELQLREEAAARV
ncbi:MmgE/PrpD family protein, partial [Burkholderia thailandensis]